MLDNGDDPVKKLSHEVRPATKKDRPPERV